MCGPAQFLWPESVDMVPMNKVRECQNRIIIGGGQIFSQLKPLVSSIYSVNKHARVVAWGVGLPPATTRDSLVRAVAQDFALFGTRNYDHREQLSFVPCASCLSPFFDQVPSADHEVVFFLHRRKGKTIYVPPGAPTMTNAMRPPQEVINFIASGETVVTSSYHGVYWAQLLGRKVICIPYNHKFETFQNIPTIAQDGDWKSELNQAKKADSLLEEYREINYKFARQVLEVWDA